MILSAHKLKEGPKLFKTACEALEKYLNGSQFGFELYIHEVETDLVRVCAWNPHIFPNRAESKVWKDLEPVNKLMPKGVKLEPTEYPHIMQIVGVEAEETKAPEVEFVKPPPLDEKK